MTAFHGRPNILGVRVSKASRTDQGLEFRLCSQRLMFGTLSNLNFLSIVTPLHLYHFISLKDVQARAQWHMPVIHALGSLRQEDGKVESHLSNSLRPCLKVKNKRSWECNSV